MPEPDVWPEVRKFILAMQPKHARQVLMRILELCRSPFPQDAKGIRGSQGEYLRVDSGEYRIVYRVVGAILEIPIVGKRNDDEVYKEMKRKGL